MTIAIIILLSHISRNSDYMQLILVHRSWYGSSNFESNLKVRSTTFGKQKKQFIHWVICTICPQFSKANNQSQYFLKLGLKFAIWDLVVYRKHDLKDPSSSSWKSAPILFTSLSRLTMYSSASLTWHTPCNNRWVSLARTKF